MSKICFLWLILIFFLWSWRDIITQIIFVQLERFRTMRFRLSYNFAFMPSLVKEDIFVWGIWWWNIVSTINNFRENHPEIYPILIDADVLLQQIWCVSIIWGLLLGSVILISIIIGHILFKVYELIIKILQKLFMLWFLLYWSCEVANKYIS